jgi:phosphatidylglycerophosphatase A
MNSIEKEKVCPDRSTLKKVALTTPSGLLAFGFGSGLSPFAPGTMGTLVAIPFIFALKSLGTPGFWIVLLLLFLLGIWLCDQVSRKLGVHDHGGIVWDEMVGYWLSMAFVPLQWQWLLAAFVLFRFFDVVKPWPIRQLDQKVSGGFGIMIDDIVAALFTIIILAVLQYLW